MQFLNMNCWVWDFYIYQLLKCDVGILYVIFEQLKLDKKFEVWDLRDLIVLIKEEDCNFVE